MTFFGSVGTVQKKIFKNYNLLGVCATQYTVNFFDLLKMLGLQFILKFTTLDWPHLVWQTAQSILLSSRLSQSCIKRHWWCWEACQRVPSTVYTQSRSLNRD